VGLGGLNDEGWGPLFTETGLRDNATDLAKYNDAGLHLLGYLKNQGAADSIMALFIKQSRCFEQDPRTRGPRVISHIGIGQAPARVQTNGKFAGIYTRAGA